ncbi:MULTISPECIES: hypothetical protein [Vibrio]|uniref:hypothetical protein n=1 Tax=Vibrio TaxID=662 RepID=UPI002075CC03|nr:MULTISPECIES: hypothetical protein [Vibrio]USD34277.1 hypothetical protein J8Z27_19775 [Vibrio sp. SCSIO 43186]USD47349.1 hypothetical protein J4N38_20180 [Vibrio sp. SCSIO 43145]USD71401.1 hypothetical protein J4N41_19785 [Vibrio sp. SCSIO 43139]USD98313.1 hypothetical protein CTT30_19980 [Vibrio coralliilyticus]
MRQRITKEQLNSALNDQDLAKAMEKLDSHIAQLSALKPVWLEFCHEKSGLATESLFFLFKQWVRLHRKGYPSNSQDYLRLVERQMYEVKQVYLAFYKLHPGLVYELKETSPELFVWLMLEPEFEADRNHLLAAFKIAESLDAHDATLLMLHSKNAYLDITLAQLVEGKVSMRQLCFELMRLRQTLSIGLAKHWIKHESLKEQEVHPVLAKFDVEDSIEWINEIHNDEKYLFELLLCKHDRGTWFRKRFGVQEQGLPSENVATYAKLLELVEFNQFDPTTDMAPVQMVLTGRPEWISSAVEHVMALDEEQGEEWLFALYIVYGDRFPLNPHDLGVEYEWGEAVVRLEDWCKLDGHRVNKPMRLGETLTYESTVLAMKNIKIPAKYRDWIWRHLCIHGRIYIPWSWTMPVAQQNWLFSKISNQPAAIERFNLRNQNATLGY